MQLLHDDFLKTIEYTRQELSADNITYDTVDGWLYLSAGDDYEWAVQLMSLWGLSADEQCNVIVDTFRKEFKQLGL